MLIAAMQRAANDTLDNTEAPEVSGMESSEFSKDDENRSHALKKKQMRMKHLTKD